MRLTPLCIFLSQLSDIDEMYKAVKAEAEFTHPNKLIHDMNFIWSATIQYLLNNLEEPNRAQKAYDLAVELSKNKATYVDDSRVENLASVSDMLKEAKNIND